MACHCVMLYWLFHCTQVHHTPAIILPLQGKVPAFEVPGVMGIHITYYTLTLSMDRAGEIP
eukprot:380636-Pelagomonas_calceolata.AAC.7